MSVASRWDHKDVPVPNVVAALSVWKLHCKVSKSKNVKYLLIFVAGPDHFDKDPDPYCFKEALYLKRYLW